MASSAYPHMIFATDKAELDRDRLVALLGECCPGGEAEQSSLKVTWTREGYAFTFWFEDADRVGEMYADYLPDGARRRPLVNATTVIDMSGAADPDGTHEGVARVIARHLAQQDGVSVFGEERKRFVGMAYGDEGPEELAALTEPAVVAAPAEDAGPAQGAAPADLAAPADDVTSTGDVACVEPPTVPTADEALPRREESTPHAEESAAPETAAPRTEGAAPQTAAAGPSSVDEPVAAAPEHTLGAEPSLSGDPEPGTFGADLVESSLTGRGDRPQGDRPHGGPAEQSPALPRADAADVTRTPGTPPEAEQTPTPAAPADRAPGADAPAPLQADAPETDTPKTDTPKTDTPAPVQADAPTAEGHRAPESPSAEPDLGAPHPPTDAQPTTEVPGGALDEQRVDARPLDVEPAVTPAGEGAFGGDLPREQAPQPTAEPRPSTGPHPSDKPQPETAPKPEKGFFKKLFGRR